MSHNSCGFVAQCDLFFISSQDDEIGVAKRQLREDQERLQVAKASRVHCDFAMEVVCVCA